MREAARGLLRTHAVQRHSLAAENLLCSFPAPQRSQAPGNAARSKPHGQRKERAAGDRLQAGRGSDGEQGCPVSACGRLAWEGLSLF